MFDRNTRFCVHTDTHARTHTYTHKHAYTHAHLLKRKTTETGRATKRIKKEGATMRKRKKERE